MSDQENVGKMVAEATRALLEHLQTDEQSVPDDEILLLMGWHAAIIITALAESVEKRDEVGCTVALNVLRTIGTKVGARIARAGGATPTSLN